MKLRPSAKRLLGHLELVEDLARDARARCCGRFAEKAEAAYARAAANASEYRRKLYELIEQRARDLLLAAVAAAELTDETREQLERLLNVHFEADRRLRGVPADPEA